MAFSDFNDTLSYLTGQRSIGPIRQQFFFGHEILLIHKKPKKNFWNEKFG